MAEIKLQMADEDLKKMLPPLKVYLPVPIKTDAEGEPLVNADGEPTGEVIDDLSYIKYLCVEHLAKCFTKGTRKLGGNEAIQAIDTDLVKSIKVQNLN